MNLKPIPNWPGYLASDDGRIFSQWRRVYGFAGLPGARCVVDPNTLLELKRFDRKKNDSRCKGYLSVHLRGKGRTRPVTVHTLVLEAFAGPRPGPGYEARHLNGNRTDNRLCNLCWGTREENHQDRVVHGTVLRGPVHGQSRLTEEKVRAIRAALREGASPSKLGKEYGVTKTAIYLIGIGKNWAHVA